MKAVFVALVFSFMVSPDFCYGNEGNHFRSSSTSPQDSVRKRAPLRQRIKMLRKKLHEQQDQKHSSLAVEATPLTSLVIPSVGFSFGSALTNDHWVELGYQYGSLRLKHIARSMGVPKKLRLPSLAATHEQETNKVYEDVQRLEIYHSYFGARIKSFWTETFYTNVGIGRRYIGLSYPVEEVTDLEGLEAEINIVRTVASFSAGNRWTWDHFLLGVDWISASLPFAWIGDRNSPNSQDMGARVNKFANTPSLSLFTIQTGVLF